jgi:hypothetical protein
MGNKHFRVVIGVGSGGWFLPVKLRNADKPFIDKR